MTIPSQMNCEHSDTGWCLECVKKLEKEYRDAKYPRSLRILMTGCGTGCGKYIRERFIEQGHKVFGVGTHGPDVQINLDCLSPYSADSIVDQANIAMGGVDVLINNAGRIYIDKFVNHPTDEFNRSLSLNLVTPFLLMKSFLYHIVSQGSTDRSTGFLILNVGSIAPDIMMRNAVGYVAAKAALVAMTKSTARELAGHDPHVSCVSISSGTILESGMREYVGKRLSDIEGWDPDRAIEYTSSKSPMGRPCTLKESWAMFDFVVNHMPEYCTGSNFQIGGGAV